MSPDKGGRKPTPEIDALLRSATGLGRKETVKALCPTTLMIEARKTRVPERRRHDYHADCQRFWRMASRAPDRRMGKLLADRFEARRIGAPLSEVDREILLTWPPHELRALAARLRSLYEDVLHPKRDLLWVETMFSPRRRPASKPPLLEVRTVTVTNTFDQLGVIVDVRWHAPWSKAVFA